MLEPELLARETGISTAQLSRWWSKEGIQSHHVRTFKLSDAPQFEAKLQDVVGVLEKTEPGVVRLSLNRSPKCRPQAQPVGPCPPLPATPPPASTTISATAPWTCWHLLDLNTGKVYYAGVRHHRHQELLACLRQLARRFPTWQVHLILHNHSPHTHSELC